MDSINEASEMKNRVGEVFAQLKKDLNDLGIDMEDDIWNGEYPVQLNYNQLVDFNIEVFCENWAERLEERERKAAEFIRQFHWIEMLQLGTVQPVMKVAFDDSQEAVDLIMAGGLEMPDSENRERVYKILSEMGYENKVKELKFKGIFSFEQEEGLFRVLKSYVENKMKSRRHTLEIFLENEMWERFEQAEQKCRDLEKQGQ